MQALDYARLLEEQRVRHKAEPRPHDVAALVPEDQYLLHFHSVRTAGDLLDLAVEWGDSLLRLARLRAQDQRLSEKLEDQLCIRRGVLSQLFGDRALIANATVPNILRPNSAGMRLPFLGLQTAYAR